MQGMNIIYFDDKHLLNSCDRFMLHLIHVTKICERTLLTHRLIHAFIVAFIIIKRRSNTIYKSISSSYSYVSMKYSMYMYEYDNGKRTYCNIYLCFVNFSLSKPEQNCEFGHFYVYLVPYV